MKQNIEGEIQRHETSIHLINAPHDEVDAGMNVPLKVRVSCPSKCNLQGSKVRIVDDEGVFVKDVDLLSFDETVNETDEFVVKAPLKPGAYTWTAGFTVQEKEGVLHEESSTPLSFIVKPHTTSIAVWDVPSPTAFNAKFKLKVGVKCSAGCKLTGKEIEIYDHQGTKVATGTLGGVPWPGTSALHWAEMETEAPGVAGYYTWAAKFPKPDLEILHEEASYNFTFTTARPPEHVVTVEITDKRTKTPIKNALVALHSCGTPYRGCTDEGGVARVSVPTGDYQLYVLGDYKDTFKPTVKVASDVTIKAELLASEREGWELL